MSRRQCLAMTGAAAVALASSLRASGSDRTVLRVAISIQTLAGANVTDARAAYRVWLREVALQYTAQTAETVPEIFISTEDLIRGIRQDTIDCYGVTALELAKLADVTDPDSLVLQDYLANGMEYVLLVHNASQFRTLGDLRGSHIVSHLHRDMVLLPAWLGTMLAANGLPQPDHFFAAQTLNDKINQVVLPVFFHRVDAACLARQSWDTAVELNPQLGRDLRTLAISPKIIPIVFGFRRNTNASLRKTLIDAIQRISSVPGGQQIVALYQSRSFVVRPISVMTPTLEMVRQFEHVSAQQGGVRKGQQ
ncbi:MAG: PhnD/SsuA/transferrin family substrate-binding protein [Terracidiphilus sp.]